LNASPWIPTDEMDEISQSFGVCYVAHLECLTVDTHG